MGTVGSWFKVIWRKCQRFSHGLNSLDWQFDQLPSDVVVWYGVHSTTLRLLLKSAVYPVSNLKACVRQGGFRMMLLDSAGSEHRLFTVDKNPRNTTKKNNTQERNRKTQNTSGQCFVYHIRKTNFYTLLILERGSIGLVVAMQEIVEWKGCSCCCKTTIISYRKWIICRWRVSQSYSSSISLCALSVTVI